MERNQEPRLTFIDTHIAVWLCAEKRRSLPAKTVAAIEEGWLAISPMVALELDFLHEIGRIKVGSAGVLNALSGLPLHIDQTPFHAVAQAAGTQTWTRDPFDRMLAAHALTAGLPLLTKDEAMLEHLDLAFWD